MHLNRNTLCTHVFKHVWFGPEPETLFLSSLEQRHRDEQLRALELAVQRLALDVERVEDRAP